MTEKGIDLTRHVSKGLNELPDGVRWDYLVTMGCGDACPHLPARRRLDWELPDPKSMDDDGFRQVRDQIEQRIRGLIEEAIAAAPSTRREP